MSGNCINPSLFDNVILILTFNMCNMVQIKNQNNKVSTGASFFFFSPLHGSRAPRSLPAHHKSARCAG